MAFRSAAARTTVVTNEQYERDRTNGIAAMEALIGAQDRHREQHGEYAARVRDLPDFALSGYALPAYFQVELDGSGTG